MKNTPELKAVYDAVEALKESPDVPRAVKSALEDMQWFEGYATAKKPTTPDMWTHTPYGIVAANWNKIHERDPVTGHWTVEIPYGATMKHLGDMLESCGVVLEWSDMVTSCDDCGQCIQTEPDSYSWTSEFTMRHGCIVCHKCEPPIVSCDECGRKVRREETEENDGLCNECEAERVREEEQS